MTVELIILAAVALFVISRLYAVLGQKTGAEPPRRLKEAVARAPEPVEEADAEPDDRPRLRPAFTGPAAAGMESIAAADPSFSPEDFIKGARRAYEVTVNAFADGDRDALKTLIDDDVYEAWSEAISQREKAGTEPMRLIRIKSARIVEAEVAGDLGRVQVSFEADLSDGETPRTAKEIWTFKRPLKASNPNWVLDEVVTAS